MLGACGGIVVVEVYWATTAGLRAKTEERRERRASRARFLLRCRGGAS